jgi:hypothetical protein
MTNYDYDVDLEEMLRYNSVKVKELEMQLSQVQEFYEEVNFPTCLDSTIKSKMFELKQGIIVHREKVNVATEELNKGNKTVKFYEIYWRIQ